MPSNLPQINVRLTQAEVELLPRLVEALRTAREGAQYNQSDAVRAGLHALARELGVQPTETKKSRKRP
jgi:hypothetical protein